MANFLRKKRFLILTGDSGFGHRSAANSIAKAIETHYPRQANTVVCNPLAESGTPFFIRKGETDYDNNVINHAGFYRFVYDISNLKTTSVLIENTVALLLQKNIQDLINRHHPEVIVTTNQWFNAPAGAAITKLNINLPLFTVVTDLADLHLLWFSSLPDQYYVASDQVRREAIENGVDARKIAVSGIPVDPFFADDNRAKAEIKRDLGLDPGKTTLLFIGSKRVRGALPYLQSLNLVRHNFELVAIAGGDDDLFFELTQQRWTFPIHIRNFVNNVPEWMRAADVLITKAGGLVVSEGMAAGLPMVLINYLPGQEEGNVKFVHDRGVGILVKSTSEFERILNELLAPASESMARYARNSRAAGHADSSIRIATDMMEASSKPIARKMFSYWRAFN